MNQTLEEMAGAHDPEGLFRVLANSHEQVTQAWAEPVPQVRFHENLRNIVMCGMGGSAISGNLAVNFLGEELPAPFFICRDYNLPPWAGKDTLVIASSYSGNTEETISALNQAIGRGCASVCITNGGEMDALAEKEGLPVIPLREGFQPRYALYWSFFTLLRFLQGTGLVPDQSAAVEQIAGMMRKEGDRDKSGDGPAMAMARRLKGKLPLVYSVEGRTDAAGLRFKAQLNENSKTHAFHCPVPEMNHNEIIGWEGIAPGGAGYAAVTIIDRDCHPRVLRCFDVFNRLMKEIGVDTVLIESAYASRKTRLLDIVYLCDRVSYFLALLNERDPGEIDYIHHMKKELSRYK